MPYREEVEVGLLIGANCVRAIKPTEVIPGKEDDPYVKKTAIGWGVIGVVSPNKNEGDDNHCSCHRIASLEVQPSNGKRMCHFALKTQAKEVFAPAQWAKMLELDFNETSKEEQPLSLLDRKFLSVLESNIRHDVPLPLKEEGLKLPNNRTLASSRLERLKQRLKRDTKYQEQYETFMKEMIDKGQAERVRMKNYTSPMVAFGIYPITAFTTHRNLTKSVLSSMPAKNSRESPSTDIFCRILI